MRYEIYDTNENGGISLFLDFENGMGITLFMEDAAAQTMVDIIQGKLNKRKEIQDKLAKAPKVPELEKNNAPNATPVN